MTPAPWLLVTALLAAVLLGAIVGAATWSRFGSWTTAWRDMPLEPRSERRKRLLRRWCRESLEAGDAGYPRQALRSARRAYRTDPGNAASLFVLGRAFEGLEQWPQAVTYLERAQRIHNDKAFMQEDQHNEFAAGLAYSLAVNHASLGRYGTGVDREQHTEQALHWLRQAVQEVPELVDDTQHEPAFSHLALQVQAITQQTLPAEDAWEWLGT